MLVLTRKYGERIICEVQPSDKVTTIELVLVRIELGQVRMGVEADKNQVNIIRSEIKPLLPVVEKPQRATSPDDGCEDDCDVDLSPQSAPMKKLGSAVFFTRKNIEDSCHRNKNADYED